jgi:predicted unusual protein kinase regulating ubiquinone biosynthesis (AarF/ABC1/UbiB family)
VIHGEIGDRLREELDYELEGRHMALYRHMLAGEKHVHLPEPRLDLSTKRLLTMSWIEGKPVMQMLAGKPSLELRNRIAYNMFRAWYVPFYEYGVIHGDPHLGNYTVFEDEAGKAAGINLLDYGCMRTFAPKFIQGVIDLYRGLLNNERALVVHAYETWGFAGLSNELIDILNIWANFIYGPMLEDRVRTIAEDRNIGMYGRREAFKVHQGLRDKGPIKVPREFVFMDRAAIGLGGVFLHLNAELNFYRLFNDTIIDADIGEVARRQKEAFAAAGVPLPDAGS